MLVSVITPNYNRTVELRRSIQSVLNQSYSEFELLVIDDGSDIDPEPIVSQFNDSRVRLIRQSRNKGAAVARNDAARIATGLWLAFLDSDDEWLPGFLESRVRLIKSSKCDWSYGACQKFVGGKLAELPAVRELKPNESMINYLLSGSLRAVTSSLMVRRDVFQGVQFDPKYVPHEDYVLNIELNKKYSPACDMQANTIYHSAEGTLGQQTHFSSLSFLRDYGDELSDRWLLFFVLRKSEAALSNGDSSLMNDYIQALNDRGKTANVLFKINVVIIQMCPSLSLVVFNHLVTAAYKLQRLKNIFQ